MGAHPSYLQDKGKVERCIQNLNREFINSLRKFPGWLKGNLPEKTFTSRLLSELPADLPTVEETLQVLAAALKAFSFLESLALEPEGKGLRKLLRF